MTLDECIEDFKKTGNTLFYTYIANERVMAEVTWGTFGPDYMCYKNFFQEAGPKVEVNDIETDTWCEF